MTYGHMGFLVPDFIRLSTQGWQSVKQAWGPFEGALWPHSYPTGGAGPTSCRGQLPGRSAGAG